MDTFSLWKLRRCLNINISKTFVEFKSEKVQFTNKYFTLWKKLNNRTLKFKSDHLLIVWFCGTVCQILLVYHEIWIKNVVFLIYVTQNVKNTICHSCVFEYGLWRTAGVVVKSPWIWAFLAFEIFTFKHSVRFQCVEKMVWKWAGGHFSRRPWNVFDILFFKLTFHNTHHINSNSAP